MIKSLFLTAALLVPAAAIAAPAEKTFTRDGRTYVYTVSTDTVGRTVIHGATAPNGTPFHYVVDGRRVEGWSGNQRVSFRAAKPIARASYPAANVVASK